jgi:hypothetical protein
MKGEEFYVGPANNRLKKIYETNYWEYRVHIKENAVWVTTIIKQFVKEYIESKVEALDTIKNKCGLELYVGLLYSKDDRLESFHLDIDLVKLFSRLNIEIDIDQHSNK